MRVDYRDSDRVWLACLGSDYRVYGYLAASGRFHFSDSLHYDYFGDRQFLFTFITAAEAADLIRAGTGGTSHVTPGATEQLVAAPWSLSAEEVLGEAAADITRAENEH
ncbi:MAG: hypothetical protein WBG36_05325 [Ornithinimicrobium sp.]